ncbi:MAG: hypothetical protein ACYTG0_40305, partial [Planctomycetota bacterium]
MRNSLIVVENESRVIGVLSGWDRLVFRGCCPLFAFLDGMLKWLLHMGIGLTGYSKWALAMSDAMKRACLEEAARRQRPIRYLRSSGARKDELARQILKEDPVSEGLVCVLTCLEPCDTYRVRGNRQTKRLDRTATRTHQMPSHRQVLARRRVRPEGCPPADLAPVWRAGLDQRTRVACPQAGPKGHRLPAPRQLFSLYPCRDADKKERCRIASRVSYRLRLLRTHGLVRKVKSRRRYHVTPKGR